MIKPLPSYTETLPNNTAFDMIFVEGGSFMMGDEKGWEREKPVRKVTVSNFYMSKYPVTQELWHIVMNENPSNYKSANRPVESVSWNGVQIFIKKLNEITSKNYYLPSEAEWEYAARGGKKSKGFTYASGNKIKEVGWYENNSHGETKPVGLKLANELGLYDMTGNVWEWCADKWHENYDFAPEDGSAWIPDDTDDTRVVRGSYWGNPDSESRVSFRSWHISTVLDTGIGFRLACPEFVKR